MPKRDKSPSPDKPTRAWPAVQKPNAPSGKFAARQKIPSGPVGGSGRKTNLSRSS